MLISIEEFIERQFGSIRPARSTLLTWIRNGKLPATKIAGRYYIDADLDLARVKEMHHER